MATRIFDKVRGVLSTTGATTATLNIAVPNNTTIGYVAKIVAKETATFSGAFFHVISSVVNSGGVLSGIGISSGNAVPVALTGATAIFTNVGTDLRLTVTGIVATTLEWQYEIETIIN